MNNHYSILALAALSLALSCTVREESVLSPEKVTFQAIQCDALVTKTELQADGSIFWSPKDSIILHYGTGTMYSWKLKADNTEPVAQTGFSGPLEGFQYNGTDSFWAIYPYSIYHDYDGSSVTVTLPEEQAGVEGTFARELFISVATSKDYTLSFYNLCGGVKFCVASSGIQYVTFKGNDDEILAGKVKVAFDANGKPQVQEVVNGKKEIRLNAPEGGFEVGKWYYIVALPATLASGYTMTFYKDEKFAERITNTSVTIKRSIWGKLTDADEEEVQPNNEIWYTSTDGEIVTPAQTYFGGANIVSNTYTNGKGVITFDADVTQLQYRNFSHCATLKSFSMPNSVTAMGDQVFEYCTALTEVKLSESLVSMGRFQFTRCALTSITLPQSLQEIEAYNIFDECSQLGTIYGKFASSDNRCLIVDGVLQGFAPAGLTTYTVPSGVTSIGAYAFDRCSSLAEIVLPSGLTSIESYAFGYCYGIESITLPTSVVSVSPGAFYSCTTLTAFYGKYASEDHRFLIKDNTILAFALPGITEYTIPEGVQIIEELAFSTSVNNTTLTTLLLPSTLTTIGQEAFERLGAWSDVVIPASVTQIGSYAFASCSGMNSLTVMASTPPVVGTSILSGAGGCTIYVPAASVDAYIVADGWSAYATRIQAIVETQPNDEIWYTSTDGNIVTPADDSGFGANIVSNTYSNGKGIIKFDGDITEVGDETSKYSGPQPFYSCQTLETISLPASVRKIGYAAFGYCFHLTSLILPEALDYLGPGIVSQAPLTSIHIPTSTVIDGNPIYWCEDLEEFTGPYSALDGHVLIKDNVLISCTPAGITSVTVPNTVTVIGESAFIDCSNLTSVSIPSGVTTIGNGAFMRCMGLQTLALPESVTYAEYNAFTGCSSLTSFHVPSQIEFQGVPFDDCTSLAEFTGRYASDDHRCLVEGTKLIAFAPAGLTSFTVPDGVTYMAGGFSSVNNLVSLDIPSTVTQITQIASTSLTTLTCRSVSPPTVSYAGNTGLAYLPALETIYVPAGSVDAYKAATCWSDHASRIQAIPSN